MRAWVDDPIQIDPPDGDDPDTVRVMTIHQAKGLEFPVVVVWDGFAEANGRTSGFWTVARAGNGLASRCTSSRRRCRPARASSRSR